MVIDLLQLLDGRPIDRLGVHLSKLSSLLLDLHSECYMTVQRTWHARGIRMVDGHV